MFPFYLGLTLGCLHLKVRHSILIHILFSPFCIYLFGLLAVSSAVMKGMFVARARWIVNLGKYVN